jgi:hypothetical protein
MHNGSLSIFQALENPDILFPRFGKKGRVISNGWKNGDEFAIASGLFGSA